MPSLKALLRAAYFLGFVFVGFMFLQGAGYYFLPLAQRPHDSLHDALKPGGIWGHGMGIVGSAMVLLLLLYSVRKKRKMGLRFGRLSSWLDVHIFFGIMGPLLITLHTAFKFNGIVSISYYSMVLVALSGVFGRYIYMQIPRNPAGHELSLAQIQERLERLESKLSREGGTRVAALQRAAWSGSGEGGRVRSVLSAVGQDMTMRLRMGRLRRALKRAGADARTVGEVVSLCRERQLLQRRIAMLDSMQQLFHLWHVFHRPFAYIMLAIMVVHVTVTVAFGYRWIF